jgi:DNA-binding PadR family transcriptional regulator
MAIPQSRGSGPILERAHLVSVTQDGQRRPRRIEAQPLAEASAWLECYREIWEANFQRLEALLDELQGRTARTRKTKTRKTKTGKTNGRTRR